MRGLEGGMGECMRRAFLSLGRCIRRAFLLGRWFTA